MVEISTDTINPVLGIETYPREIDGQALVVVKVPRGDSVYERAGKAFIRVGGSRRLLDSDERMRLAQRRAQGGCRWFDRQIVGETGFHTLDEQLWMPLLSAAGAANPRRALRNQGLLAHDEA
ncbi:MAG: hypothetical protein OXM02_15140 [Bacteroidota bacterium]|nr:hypothetical protein [Bacteroidota bacterium]